MSTYQCWCPTDNRVPNEDIGAASSFAARQKFARRHHKQISDCAARRQRDQTARVFSDGTSIRDEP